MDKTKLPKKKPGRPSKFKLQYNKEMIGYFSIAPYKQEPVEHFNITGGVKWIEYKKVPNDLPTFNRFASQIGVDDDTLENWAKEENKKKYPGFFGAYKKAKKLQKEFLIENGLRGLYQPAFAIFTATNITDMKNQKYSDLTSQGEKIDPIQVIIVEDKPNE